MMKPSWGVLVLSVLFTAIGAGGGWYAARQGVTAEAGGDHDHADDARADRDHDHGHGEDHDHDHHEDHDHDHDHDDDHDHVVLPPETLRNLGVELGRLEATTFVRHRAVPARVIRSPFAERPVTAALGGRVRSIFVEPGQVVRPGEPLLEIVREPIARPALTLTGEILQPAREAIHESVSELRRAVAELEIVRGERERVARFSGGDGAQGELPVLPRQKLIELGYQQTRAEIALHAAEHELLKHGFSEEQVEAVAKGGALPDLGKETWKRALERNGLWTEAAERLYAALSEELRGERWVVATVGELAAGGLVDGGLAAWIAGNAGAAEHILAIGSLLQQGYSVEHVRELEALGALEAIFVVRAPESGDLSDWDVETVAVRAGARVEPGATLLHLLDVRQMRLTARPAGAEKVALLDALAGGERCEARPLLADTGPELRGLAIDYVRGDDSGGTLAVLRVPNDVLALETREGRRFRSWGLREGMRYQLRVPVGRRDGVFVLPAAALTTDGPNQIVLVPEGESFHEVPVEVLHRDRDVVVLAADPEGTLKPGDEVVVRGAYELHLALTAPEAGAADHHHHH